MEIKFDPQDLQPLIRDIVRETAQELERGQSPTDKPSQSDELEPLLLNARTAAKLLSISEKTL